MPFVELVFPHFSQDEKGRNGQAEYKPKLLQLLKDRGVFHGHQGLILKENSEDVTAAQRQVMFLQWPNKEGFFAFAESAEYGAFGQAVKPFSVKAPELHLVETQPKGLEDLRKFPFLGLTLIKPGKGDMGNAKGKVEQGFEAALGVGGSYGVTLNLDEEELVLLEGFADVKVSLAAPQIAHYLGSNKLSHAHTKAFDEAQTELSRAAFLRDIRKLANVYEILAQIHSIPGLP
ncbi:hypothetical protein CC79DRAFT_1369084 [Sarocladium strictum]